MQILYQKHLICWLEVSNIQIIHISTENWSILPEYTSAHND